MRSNDPIYFKAKEATPVESNHENFKKNSKIRNLAHFFESISILKALPKVFMYKLDKYFQRII